MMKGFAALWSFYVVAANIIEQFQLPLAQPLLPFNNQSLNDPFWDTRKILEPRQGCYAPNAICSSEYTDSVWRDGT
jgi:hypothetical protein